MRKFIPNYLFSIAYILSWLQSLSYADGLSINKIYHPYVQPLERELEWRVVATDLEDDAESIQKHLLAYGQTVNDSWFAEIYMVAEKLGSGKLDVNVYEIELKKQLTEQGEYAADFALLFELEKEKDLEIWEFATSLIIEKEWGQWSGTANAFIVSEWGDDVQDEIETKLNLQARYRHSRFFEPALEMYIGQDTRGVGPVVLGQYKLAEKQKIKWEAGAIFGVGDKTPDTTFRFLLEYEF